LSAAGFLDMDYEIHFDHLDESDDEAIDLDEQTLRRLVH